MTAPLVTIENLVRRYGSKTALDGVSLELAGNETVGLVGKNGAGKTTLLSVMAGLMPPTSGRVSFREHTSAAVGFQAQDNCFKPGIAVLRQLVHLARLQGMTSATATAELARLGAELGLEDHINRPVETLSHGLRKRVNVLQAFLGSPALILLDEPTAGLDPAAAAIVRDMIRSRSGDTTFLISSHNLYELQDICRRVILLDRGTITDNIDLEERPDRDRFLRLTLDHDAGQELLETLSNIPGIGNVETDRYDARKLTFHVSSGDPDSLQITVQNCIHEQGYSILQLSRGKSLSEEVAGRS